ncbi:MAG: hypothetical protein LBS31_08655, partial [Candidatus Adiutrix sp.]|nr:hypothetical protein [Candidatus Adiutrix sp.]
MSAVLTRVSLISEKDPNQRLADFFGEKFAAYRRAWAEAESGRAPLAPLHLDIDVTTACNLACPMCPAGNSGHNFPGFKKGLRLSRTIYRKALAEGAAFGLPSLRLGLTGEPLLEPDIHHWVREAREA